LFKFFAKHSLLSIIILLIPTIGSLFFLDQIKSDPSFDRLLIKDDPEKIFYKAVTDEFGEDNSALIYFEGPEILKRENLIKIRQFVWDIEELEEVRQVDSLFTTPHFVGEDGLLSTIPALEDLPEDQAEIDRIIQSTIDNPLIATRLIAKDKSSIVVNIQLDSSKRALKEIAHLINDKLASIDPNVTQKFQTGMPSIELFTFGEMTQSQRKLLPFVILAISFFVFLGTRSIHAALIPCIVVFLGILWTGACMVFLKIPVQLLVSCVPAITFILATTEIVHIMTAYKEQTLKGNSKAMAISEAMDEVALPISLTALTTTLGFGAICVNKIIMLQEFGIVSAIALVSSFIITVLYTPLHIKFFASSNIKRSKEASDLAIFKKISKKFFNLKNYKKIVFTSLLVYMAFNLYQTKFVLTDNDSINLIKKTAEPRINLDKFEEHFGGIESVFLILELSESNFKDPKYLKILFDLERELNNFPEFYDAESFGGLMAHINNQMITSVSGMDQYQTPRSKQLVAQYLLSLTRDDYEKYVSANFKKANLTIRHSISSSNDQEKAMLKLQSYLEKRLSGLPISFKFTARSILNQRAGKTIIVAQTQSIIMMIIIIFILMSILFKDLRMGLAAIPPNFLPILGLFGSMGFLGIPLNIGSCIVAAITVGIAVDDTIHFFTRFKENLDKTNSAELAAKETLDEESAPIVITSISLSIGFSILMLSQMVPLNQFGLLSAIVIILAMLADLIITPAIMSIMGRIYTDKKGRN